MNRDLNTLKESVENWAKEKGIWGGDFLPQFKKFKEEVWELTDELLEDDDTPRDDIDHRAMEEEMGDVLVTLIILASKLNTTPEESLGRAYDKIAKRTGRVIDGAFVKEEDLPQ